MTPLLFDQWKDEVVGEVLKAMVASPPLRDALVFKGARILHLHLGTDRQSLDIDSNFDVAFVEAHPGQEAQQAWMAEHLPPALTEYFEQQDPVRFELQQVTVRRNPPPRQAHPHGWDGLEISVRVTDARHASTRGLPAVIIDVAAPEDLGPDAVESLRLNGFFLHGYALHRIAGEKLRAFLTSLPAYQRKLQRTAHNQRVKDLHDLAQVLAARPAEDEAFWRKAAAEFQRACRSRYVDCAGLATFQEAWEQTQQAYTNDPKLTAVPFAKAEAALVRIMDLFTRWDLFPLSFAVPEIAR